MKKVFLLSALALAAMTMSAQITLDGTYSGHIYNDFVAELPINKYVSTSGDSLVLLFHENLSLYKRIALSTPFGETFDSFKFFCQNIFTTDGKVCFIFKTNKHEYLYNEDGECIYTFNSESWKSPWLFRINNKYKLMNDVQTYFEFYSLPGAGETPTDLESPTAPTRTSNARKVVENGQLYIILDGVKYAVTGNEL